MRLVKSFKNRRKVLASDKPSARELADWDEKEYGPYEICDDHYETATALRISRMIVASLDGLDIE